MFIITSGMSKSQILEFAKAAWEVNLSTLVYASAFLQSILGDRIVLTEKDL